MDIFCNWAKMKPGVFPMDNSGFVAVAVESGARRFSSQTLELPLKKLTVKPAREENIPF